MTAKLIFEIVVMSFSILIQLILELSNTKNNVLLNFTININRQKKKIT